MKKKNIRYYTVSCLKEHKVLLCWTAITQTPVLLRHEDPSLLVAAHRFHTDPHYTNRLGVLVLREDLESICPLSSWSLLFPKMAGKSMEFSRTHILRDAPRFTGEQAHWVDCKEKLDDILFFRNSSLRDILQGKRGQRSTCLFHIT